MRANCTTEGIVSYLELHFCDAERAGRLAIALLVAACALALLMLLRALGSTAECFFSPILARLSQAWTPWLSLW